MASLPSSPKRYGLIVDGLKWPLSDDHSLESVPALTQSTSPVHHDEDTKGPPTPTNESFLPGFHFTIEDENYDEAEFHRNAALLLSGEGHKHYDNDFLDGDLEAMHRRKQQNLHCDLGCDETGSFCCSCGRTYSTASRLRQHIQKCAGTTNSPCPSCDRVFKRQASLDRHIAMVHNWGQVACPGCGQHFPTDYLPKHLASGLGGCDGMAQAVCIDGDSHRDGDPQEPLSQQFWIYDGDHSWHAHQRLARDSGIDMKKVDANGAVDETVSFVTGLLRRPGYEPTSVTCELCDETFKSDGDEFAQHIGQHSLDFAEKRHKCDECQIFFASEKDLTRHLQSVELDQHCGFTFRHAGDHGACNGHHPPVYYKACLDTDHDLMQRHLWAWELAQLRQHRAIVARLLAGRLARGTNRMSLRACQSTYAALYPHISLASTLTCNDRASFARGSIHRETSVYAPAPALQTICAPPELDEQFHRVMLETYPDEEPPRLEAPEELPLSDRPDSGILMTSPSDINQHRGSSRDDSDALRRKSLRNLARLYRRKTLTELSSLFKSHAAAELDRPHSLPPPLPTSGATMPATVAV